MTNENENEEKVSVRIVSIGDVRTLTVDKGSTISELKTEYGYDETVKIADKGGIPLSDNYVIEEDMDLYLTVPKSNG